MKLLRYGKKGQEKPGMLDKAGKLRDLSATVADINPETLAPAALDRLRNLDPASLPLVAGEPRIGACVTQIPKIVCVGLNYTDHAKETNSPIPKEPILFMKATSSLSGPYDEVMLPKGSQKSDWEVELGIVIGSVTRYVSVHDALKHIAGYCIVNDVSEREFQIERGGQWTKGKSADTFCPIGPWLVTADEVPDPGKLELFLEVNGKTMQKGTTANLIFHVAHIVSYISHFMTLMPGDVIPTGTPAGVGLGMKPPVFLKPGDTMRLGITGLGEQHQKVVAFRE
jgi:2-keto-4-pentenoate hydratase/2-oxohepta-3-ene-1,7-dioic acid hydratase in catechol pathway